jgi:hypothetical protein
MSKLLALLVRKIAEGDFGEPLKRVYWWLAGKKTYIGMAFGASWAMLAWAQDVGVCTMRGWDCAGWSTTLASVAAFLVLVGLWDGALRSQPPNK